MNLAPLFIAAAFATSAFAQDAKPNPRYEIMWRMREFDRVWLAHTGSEERTQALQFLPKARQSALEHDVGGAAQALDSARSKLDGRWSDAGCLSVTPTHRLLDGDNTLSVTASQLYGQSSLFPWYLWFDSALTKGEVSPIEIDFNLGVLGWQTKIDALHAGDYKFVLSITDGDVDYHHRDFQLSVVENRNARLAALDKALAALPETAPRLERETLAALNVLLNSLALGSTEETDYPAARLLAEAEQVAAAAAKSEPWYGPSKTGQFWLALMAGDLPTRVRLLVPQHIDREKPTALVIALSAAPYSENRFFDGYGDGQIVKLCEDRNWLLVAPKSNGGVEYGSIVALIDAMAAIYPVDRSRVFLLGHSQGAGFGVEAARAAPTKFRGVAALSHGFAVKDVGALKDVPIFIAAGDHDEFRSNAAQVTESLRAAGSKVATFKIYPNCDREMVVADALPDVFAWFSSLAH